MATSTGRRTDGRQSRWDRHNRDRRQHLIESAIAEIEAGVPGADVHVQQIAARAGVGRTVVYRHFDDRADLDRAVTTEVVETLSQSLIEAVSLNGTVPDIVRRVVGIYVQWAVDHPALHLMVSQGNGLGGTPLEAGLGRISGQVLELLTYVVEALGLKPTEDQRSALDPLAFGLVGAVFGAVRRWASADGAKPPPEVLVDLVADSVWFLISGYAAQLGLVLQRDQPVEDVLLAATAEPVT